MRILFKFSIIFHLLVFLGFASVIAADNERNQDYYHGDDLWRPTGLATRSLRRGTTKSSKKDSKLRLCVVDSRGFPIPEDSPAYDRGIVQYSTKLTPIEAASATSDVLSTISEFAFAAGIVVGVGSGGTALAVALVVAAVGFAFQVAAFFVGKSETDVTQALIINEFAKTNAKIDLLSAKVEDFYNQIRIDIGDAVLDSLNNRLSRMAAAYEDYVKTVDLSNSTSMTTLEKKNIRKIYREKFR